MPQPHYHGGKSTPTAEEPKETAPSACANQVARSGGRHARKMALPRSPFEQSRWCGGRFACAHFNVVALIGVLSGHKEVPYDPFSPNDARRTRASELL